jgi:hypothetical protein
MTLTIGNITFDCENPIALAEFWSTAIDRKMDDGPNHYFASIGVTDDELPRWLFLKVPEPKDAKNRCHLDMASENRSADIERLVAIGATHVADKAEHGHEWSVMNDPEGNEFCIGGPMNP